MKLSIKEVEHPVLEPSITLSWTEHDALVKGLQKYFTEYNRLNRTKRYNEEFSEIKHIEIEGVVFKVDVIV